MKITTPTPPDFFIANIVQPLEIDAAFQNQFLNLKEKQETSYRLLQSQMKVFKWQLGKFVVSVGLPISKNVAKSASDYAHYFLTPSEFLWGNGIDEQEHLGLSFSLFDTEQAAIKKAKELPYPMITIYQVEYDSECECVWFKPSKRVII